LLTNKFYGTEVLSITVNVYFQAEYISWGPAAVFAAMNVIVTLSLLLLPETMGRELPTTVAELKTWYKNKVKYNYNWQSFVY